MQKRCITYVKMEIGKVRKAANHRTTMLCYRIRVIHQKRFKKIWGFQFTLVSALLDQYEGDTSRRQVWLADQVHSMFTLGRSCTMELTYRISLEHPV